MKYYKILLLIFLIIFNSGCNNKGKTDESSLTEKIYTHTENVVTTFKDIAFTEEEIDRIKKLQEKGVLRIATRESEITYDPQIDGTIKGFHYLLIKNFADEIGIDIEVVLVSFKDYFSVNGKTPEEIFSNNDYTYIPHLLSSVDLYIDTLTALPCRQHIPSSSPIIPTKIVYN